jgi:hypothetical protein
MISEYGKESVALVETFASWRIESFIKRGIYEIDWKTGMWQEKSGPLSHPITEFILSWQTFPKGLSVTTCPRSGPLTGQVQRKIRSQLATNHS